MGFFDTLKNMFFPKAPAYMQSNQTQPGEQPNAETIAANQAFYARAFVALVATQFNSAGKDYKKYTELMRVKDLPDAELIKYSGMYAGVCLAKGETENTIAMMNGLVAEFPEDPLLLDYFVQLVRDIDLDKDAHILDQLLVPKFVNEIEQDEPLLEKQLYINYSEMLLDSVLSNKKLAYDMFKTKMLKLGFNEKAFIDRTYELASISSFEDKKEKAILLYNGLVKDYPDSAIVNNLEYEIEHGRKQFLTIMSV